MMRYKFNLFPAFRRTGGKISYISEDMRKVSLKISLNWKTRNIVGTLYGGSLYGAVDPIYMVMFMKLLGSNYIVWDKAAVISFKKPVRTDVYANFKISAEDLTSIKEELENSKNCTRIYNVKLFDKKKKECVEIEKTLYFQKNRLRG